MSDLEDDWWEKDIESFTVPTSTDQKQRGLDDSSDVHENLMQSQDYNLDKGKLLAFMKNDIGGNYSKGMDAKSQSKLFREQGGSKNKVAGDSETFIQKLPLTKLCGIAKQSKLKAFIDLIGVEDEFLETLKQKKISERMLLMGLTVLKHVCNLPFQEHKAVLMKQVLEINSFWLQVETYVKANQKQNLTSGELNECLLSIAREIVKIHSTEINDVALKCWRIVSEILLKKSVGNSEVNEFWKYFSSKINIQSKEKNIINDIIPSKNELLNEVPISLQSNIVKGAFPSVTEYKNLHLSLLKEDFVASIRDSLQTYIELHGEEAVVEGRIDNICILKRVQLCHTYSKAVPIYVDLKFNELLERERRQLLKEKRFMSGALLMFTTNIPTLDDLILATVLPQDEELKQKGIVPVEIIDCSDTTGIFSGQLICIEPLTYFEPYHRVYNVLSGLSDLEMPMKQYLVDAKCTPHRGLDPILIPDCERDDLDLNASQKEAYQAAVSNDFCLIQGPPGTGKTSVGVKILLNFLRKTDQRILIVCYTNHALDQTLTGILKDTQNIIRFGDQSQSDALKQYNYKEVYAEKRDEHDKSLNFLWYKTLEKHSKLLKEFIRIQCVDDQENLIEKIKVLKDLQIKIRSVSKKLHELRQLQAYFKIQDRRVFGMTTTFAARSHALLELLQIPIVLIEEAGEILEAHIVASLTPFTQRLILIGDHYQLRPTTSVYRMSKQYKMDISLFERMINNQINFVQLKEQHRMRQEFSNLIKNTIYPELDDAPNVLLYENIKGMSKNLFFFTHNIPEQGSQSDENSKTNYFEAVFIGNLCSYLIKQGNPMSKITILTMYAGQRYLIQRTINEQHPEMSRIRISVVDNFQGEENDIILLSLVRSNKKKIIGFLGMKNRICVALSRAKRGFYLIGNMEQLKEVNSTWNEINGKLEITNAVGAELETICQLHNQTWRICTDEKFLDVGCDMCR